MPKVTRHDAKKQPLQEAGPSGMEIEAGEQLPQKPTFAPLSEEAKAAGDKVEFRRIPVPQHRMTPLKTHWLELYKPITENLKLDMRMNLKTKKVRRFCLPPARVGAAVVADGACTSLMKMLCCWCVAG